MAELKKNKKLGFGFIENKYIPANEDEYYLRNKRITKINSYRKLKAEEIKTLEKNRNTADDWTNIFVSQQFDPNKVKNCDLKELEFAG